MVSYVSVTAEGRNQRRDLRGLQHQSPSGGCRASRALWVPMGAGGGHRQGGTIWLPHRWPCQIVLSSSTSSLISSTPISILCSATPPSSLYCALMSERSGYNRVYCSRSIYFLWLPFVDLPNTNTTKQCSTYYWHDPPLIYILNFIFFYSSWIWSLLNTLSEICYFFLPYTYSENVNCHFVHAW